MPQIFSAYLYEELSEQAKKKACDEWRHSLSGGDPFLSECITEDFTSRLEELGLPTDMSWSLGYCQGDGVAFTGYVDLEKYTEVHELRGWGPVEEFYTVRIYNHSRYSHWNSMTLEVSEEGDLDDPVAFWVTQHEDKLREHIEERIKEVSRELEETGYAEIEYRDSDEFVSEEIQHAEWMFTEDGEHLPIRRRTNMVRTEECLTT